MVRIISMLMVGCAMVAAGIAVGAETPQYVGTWHAPSGAAVEITADGKWIGHLGPQKVAMVYTVTKVDGKRTHVLLRNPAQKNDQANVTLSVEGETLTVTGGAWGGKWSKTKPGK